MPKHELRPLLGTSHFRVLIGRQEVGFAEVGRLSSVTGEDGSPGFETVVLRRSLGHSTELYDWRLAVAAGKDDRRPVTIEQLGAPGGRVVNAWRLEGAWPVRWSGPAFDAARAAIAIEELELAFERLVWLQEAKKPVNPSRRTKGS